MSDMWRKSSVAKAAATGAIFYSQWHSSFMKTIALRSHLQISVSSNILRKLMLKSGG